MGYDMYWREQHPEVAAAREAVYANVSSASDGLYDAWNEAEKKYGGYFRLNVWGMDEYRGYMHERGMLDITSEQPEYPKWQAFGVTQTEYDSYPKDKAAQSPAFQAWRTAVDAWTEQSPGGKMPVYKFGSNDGWLVTPDEITKSLQALEEWERKQRDLNGQSWVDPLRGEDDGYWDEWIRFIYCARNRGGFEVN